MSRPPVELVKLDEVALQKMKEGPNLSTDDNFVQIAEIQGKRPSQQDVIFVGLVGNEELKSDPKNFLKAKLTQISEDHKHHFNGTTACAAVAVPVEKDGARTVKITTANMGDSRAFILIVVKKPGGEISCRQKLLTQDHTAEYYKNHIESHGGVIVNGRINGLAMGSSIGDYRVGMVVKEGSVQDCCVRAPEIKEFYLADFCKEGEELLSAEMLVTCDGFWEKSKLDFVMRHKLESLKNPNERNLTKAMVDSAFDQGSTDNISASKLVIFGKKSQVEYGASAESSAVGVIDYGAPVMMAVFDGHGDGELSITGDDSSASVAVEKATLCDICDGAIVSASVAADLFIAADIKQFEGVEIAVPGAQDWLSKMVDLRRINARKPSPNYQDLTTEAFKMVVNLMHKNTAPTPYFSQQNLDNALDVLINLISAIDKEAIRTVLQEAIAKDPLIFNHCNAILEKGKKAESPGQTLSAEKQKFMEEIRLQRLRHLASPFCDLILETIQNHDQEVFQSSQLSQLSQSQPLEYEGYGDVETIANAPEISASRKRKEQSEAQPEESAAAGDQDSPSSSASKPKLQRREAVINLFQ